MGGIYAQSALGIKNREKFKKWGSWKGSKSVDQKTDSRLTVRFFLFYRGFGAFSCLVKHSRKSAAKL